MGFGGGFTGGGLLEPAGGEIPGGILGGAAGAAGGAETGSKVGAITGGAVGALIGGAIAAANCDDDCDVQYDNDSSVCRVLPDKNDRRRCWASAAQRYANCKAGRPVQPLDW